MGINLKPNEDEDVPTVPVRENKAKYAAGKRDESKSSESAPAGGSVAADPQAKRSTEE